MVDGQLLVMGRDISERPVSRPTDQHPVDRSRFRFYEQKVLQS